MTRALQDAHWSGAPSLSQLWLAALLRLAAMLVSNVAAQVRMIASVLSGECHTDVDPAHLPEPKRDPIKETEPAAGSSQTTQALILSSAAKAVRRVHPELVEGSKDEGVLTGDCCNLRSGQSIVRVPGEGRGPSNHLDPCIAFRLQPQAATSLDACAGPQPEFIPAKAGTGDTGQ